MSDIILICPHCQKEITESDLKNSVHSWANVEKFLEKQKTMMLKEIETEVKKTLSVNFEKEKEIEVLKIQNKFQEIIDKLEHEKESNKLKFDAIILDKKQEYDLLSAKLINQKQEEISQFKTQLAENEFKLQQVKDDQELLISSKLNENENKYLEIVNNLKMNILNLEKSQETLIIKKQNEFKEEIKPVIDGLKEQLLRKEIELNNKEVEFQLQLNTTQAEIDKKYQLQIEELKIANAQNKILQSKRKGENFEHEVEGELRKAFGIFDSISKINATTGDKKADYLQIIKNSNGTEIGKIVYEVKNAEWKDSWEGKLATDVANNKTKYGILIATSFNEQYNGIPFIRSERFPNIWITDSESFIFVGQIVRKLIEVENEFLLKTQLLTKDSSAEVIKEYEMKKAKLDAYWTVDFPKTLKIIETELKAIDSVKSSLDNNAAKLAKASVRLNDQLKTKIIKGLSNILGELIIEDGIE